VDSEGEEVVTASSGSYPEEVGSLVPIEEEGPAAEADVEVAQPVADPVPEDQGWLPVPAPARVSRQRARRRRDRHPYRMRTSGVIPSCSEEDAEVDESGEGSGAESSGWRKAGAFGQSSPET